MFLIQVAVAIVHLLLRASLVPCHPDRRDGVPARNDR